MSDWGLASIRTAYYYVGLVLLLSVVTALVVSLIYGFVHLGERPATAGAADPPVARRPWLTGPRLKTAWRSALKAFPFVLMIGLVGGLAGQLGGSSRTGVVGDLLPALVTLLGGFVAYYLGAKRDRSGKVLVNTLAFLLCFFPAYNVASVWRQSNENWEFCRGIFSNPAYDQAGRADRNYYWSTFCDGVFKQWTATPTTTPSASGPTS